jgi:flagellar motility protein MotE (MotC chaperone)
MNRRPPDWWRAGAIVLLFAGGAVAEEPALGNRSASAGPSANLETALKVPSPTGQLAKQLEERQLELDRREAAIRRDEERLRILRENIEGLMNRKQPPTGPAGQAAGTQPPTATPGLTHLSQAFEAMPSEEAAQRIEKMNEPVALELLSRLKSKTAGAILASLSPAKAARLIEKMAGERPRSPGKSDK